MNRNEKQILGHRQKTKKITKKQTVKQLVLHQL